MSIFNRSARSPETKAIMKFKELLNGTLEDANVEFRKARDKRDSLQKLRKQNSARIQFASKEDLVKEELEIDSKFVTEKIYIQKKLAHRLRLVADEIEKESF